MKLVIIMGPTAAGKSALALKLAKRFDGEIITADSRQVYRGMDIGTDKPESRESGVGSRVPYTPPPTPNTLGRDEPRLIEGIPHYLMDILTPDQRYSAAEFRGDAGRCIAAIHRRGKLPIVVGGTGFYLRVLTGDRSLPDVPPDSAFRAWAATQPANALAQELRARAPDLYAKVDNVKNRRRVTRYLEVARARATGEREQGTGDGKNVHHPAWEALKIALLPPSDTLRKRIEDRVDEMFRRGFLEEVRRLVATYGPSAPGLQSVGYRQAIELLDAGAPKREIRDAVVRAHRDYARRQRTWLKGEPGIIVTADPAAALAYIARFLATSRQ